MQPPGRPIKKVLRDNDAYVAPTGTITEHIRVEWAWHYFIATAEQDYVAFIAVLQARAGLLKRRIPYGE